MNVNNVHIKIARHKMVSQLHEERIEQTGLIYYYFAKSYDGDELIYNEVSFCPAESATTENILG